MPIQRIYFKARNWEFNKACSENKGERCFISGLSNNLEEVFSIGSRENSRTEIISKPMMLEKHTLYRFSFWLKEVEKEEGSKNCKLHVIFDGKNDQVYQYKLSQNYINPIKIVEGWRLYDISFETQTNSVTQLKFVVEGATIMIMSAQEPSEYKDLKDDRLVKQKEKEFQHQSLTNNEIVATNLYQQILSKLEEGYIQEQIMDDIVTELVKRIEKDIDLENLVKEFSGSMNTKQLQGEIRNVLKEHIRKENQNIKSE